LDCHIPDIVVLTGYWYRNTNKAKKRLEKQVFIALSLNTKNKYVYWNLLYPLSILKVIFLESNPLRFIETLISFIRAYVYCLYRQVEKIRRRRHRAILQNYKATWTSLLTNEKVKSTSTRRLLLTNHTLTWALILMIECSCPYLSICHFQLSSLHGTLFSEIFFHTFDLQEAGEI
jgi:glucose-6-phosphate-specific signal transduction histidine kinase